SVLYRSALDLAPGDPATVDRLVRLYERTGHLAELAALLEGQISQFQQLDVRKAQALRLKAGDLYARSLNSGTRAIGLYCQVVEQDPHNEEAYGALAALYEQDTVNWPHAV